MIDKVHEYLENGEFKINKSGYISCSALSCGECMDSFGVNFCILAEPDIVNETKSKYPEYFI